MRTLDAKAWELYRKPQPFHNGWVSAEFRHVWHWVVERCHIGLRAMELRPPQAQQGVADMQVRPWVQGRLGQTCRSLPMGTQPPHCSPAVYREWCGCPGILSQSLQGPRPRIGPTGQTRAEGHNHDSRMLTLPSAGSAAQRSLDLFSPMRRSNLGTEGAEMGALGEKQTCPALVLMVAQGQEVCALTCTDSGVPGARVRAGCVGGFCVCRGVTAVAACWRREKLPAGSPQGVSLAEGHNSAVRQHPYTYILHGIPIFLLIEELIE